jgi:hypothetical protein
MSGDVLTDGLTAPTLFKHELLIPFGSTYFRRSMITGIANISIDLPRVAMDRLFATQSDSDRFLVFFSVRLKQASWFSDILKLQ